MYTISGEYLKVVYKTRRISPGCIVDLENIFRMYTISGEYLKVVYKTRRISPGCIRDQKKYIQDVD